MNINSKLFLCYLLVYGTLVSPFFAIAGDKTLSMEDFYGTWEYIQIPEIKMTIKPGKINWTEGNGEATYKVIKELSDSVITIKKDNSVFTGEPRYHFTRFSFFEGHYIMFVSDPERKDDINVGLDSCDLYPATLQDHFHKSPSELWDLMMAEESRCQVNPETGETLGQGWSSAGGYRPIKQ